MNIKLLILFPSTQIFGVLMELYAVRIGVYRKRIVSCNFAILCFALNCVFIANLILSIEM